MKTTALLLALPACTFSIHAADGVKRRNVLWLIAEPDGVVAPKGATKPGDAKAPGKRKGKARHQSIDCQSSILLTP